MLISNFLIHHSQVETWPTPKFRSIHFWTKTDDDYGIRYEEFEIYNSLVSTTFRFLEDKCIRCYFGYNLKGFSEWYIQGNTSMKDDADKKAVNDRKSKTA